MKGKIRIKNIMLIAAVGIISLFFINMSLAANTGKVIVETANLRETADEDAKKLELLSLNDKVEIIEKTGEWYKVKAKGTTGYLRQDLIEVSEEAKKVNEVSKEETTETTNTTETTQTSESEQNAKTIETGKKFVTEDTKLKIVPVINATDIVEVKKDEEVNVIETVNGWVCVETQTTKGWIRADKLKEEKTVEEKQPEQEQPEQNNQEKQATKLKTLYVNVAKVNLRKEASKSSEVIANLTINTAVEVISEENGWSKVKVGEKEGYIASSYLSDKKQETSRSLEKPRQNTEKATAPVPVSGKGNNVVETAKMYLGCKYIHGGTSPERGFDCSGFTSYVFRLHGVSLNRTAAGQYSNGVAVNRSDLQPGDLVMFKKGSSISHVAIYIGGGQIIHAQSSSTGVSISTINSGYYNTYYYGARRVI